jgi:hypothetical protein
MLRAAWELAHGCFAQLLSSPTVDDSAKHTPHLVAIAKKQFFQYAAAALHVATLIFVPQYP